MRNIFFYLAPIYLHTAFAHFEFSRSCTQLDVINNINKKKYNMLLHVI